MKIKSKLPLLLVYFLLFSNFLRADVITHEIGKGVVYSQQTETSPLPLLINVLKIDLSVPGVRVRCGLARDAVTISGPSNGREGVHSIAIRNKAIAAVNADYFPYTGDPLGLAIRDGELLSEPMEYRSTLGISPQGAFIDILLFLGSCEFSDSSKINIDGVNRMPSPNEIVVLTPSFTNIPSLSKDCTIVTVREVNLPVKLSSDIQGRVEAINLLHASQPLPECPADGVLIAATGSAALSLTSHCKLDDKIKIRFDLASNANISLRGKYPGRAALSRNAAVRPVWKNVTQAVGGGPWLVRAGEVQVDSDGEDFPRIDFAEKRHPRTAAGITRDGKLLLVTVDGRQSFSVGCSLIELAEVMKRLGAWNAMNLDGGGSTTMFVGGGVVNSPSDGRERLVADSLLVYAEQDSDMVPPPIPSANLLPSKITVMAGESARIPVNDLDGKAIDSNKLIWGTEDGLGFVSQMGIFRGTRAGSSFVLANTLNQHFRIPVTVEAAAPEICKTSFQNEANNPPDRNILHLTILDRFGNLVSGAVIQVHVTGGDSVPPLTTDIHGTAETEIVWDVEPGKRSLRIDFGNGHSLTLKK